MVKTHLAVIKWVVVPWGSPGKKEDTFREAPSRSHQVDKKFEGGGKTTPEDAGGGKKTLWRGRDP